MMAFNWSDVAWTVAQRVFIGKFYLDTSLFFERNPNTRNRHTHTHNTQKRVSRMVAGVEIFWIDGVTCAFGSCGEESISPR